MKTSLLEEFGIMFHISIDGCWVRGAYVALVAASKAKVIAQDVLERYRRSHYVDSAVLARLPTATVLQVMTKHGLTFAT